MAGLNPISNRMKHVSIDGILSDLLKVNFGVAQGSCISAY